MLKFSFWFVKYALLLGVSFLLIAQTVLAQNTTPQNTNKATAVVASVTPSATPSATTSASDPIVRQAMQLKAQADVYNQEYDRLIDDSSSEYYPWLGGYRAAYRLVDNRATVRSYYYSFDIPGRGKLLEQVKNLGLGIADEKQRDQKMKKARSSAKALMEESLKLLESAPAAMRDKPEFQHALVMAYVGESPFNSRVGLTQLEKALEIQLRLVKSDPKNISWQLTLADVYRKLAREQKGNDWLAPHPKTALLAEVEIRDKLQDADPQNPQLRHDLVANHLRLAERFALFGHGQNLDYALTNAIDLIKDLKMSDYSEQWQHEFALDLGRIGLAQRIRGSGGSTDKRAKVAYDLALPLLSQHAKQQPANRAWQRDYARYLIESSDAESSAGKAGEQLAKERLNAAIELYKNILERDLGNVRSQVDLLEAIKKSASFYEARTSYEYEPVIEIYSQGQKYFEALSAKTPNDLGWLYYQLELFGKIGFYQENSLRARLGGYPDGPGAEGEAARKKAKQNSSVTSKSMLAIIEKLIELELKTPKRN